MSDTNPLPSYKTDFTDDQFREEMDRVRRETDIERTWFGGMTPYQTDVEAYQALEKGELVRVDQFPGIAPIMRLSNHTPERSDPSHQYYYSPPFLHPYTYEILRRLVEEWRSQVSGDVALYLPLTSATRSVIYQRRLYEQPGRSLAVDSSNAGIGGHMFGYSFDIDATGLYVENEDKTLRMVNPRVEGFEEYKDLITRSRNILKSILEKYKDQGTLNFVEEVPNTQEWCLHVTVKPKEQS